MKIEYDKECPLDLKSSLGRSDIPSQWVRPNRPWFKNYPDWMPKTLSYETIEKLNGLFCILKIAALNFPNNVAVYFKEDFFLLG